MSFSVKVTHLELEVAALQIIEKRLRKIQVWWPEFLGEE